MTDQYWSPAKQDPSAIPFRNKFDGARDPLTARNAIGALGEAPSDSQQYAREDGAWTVISSSTSTITVPQGRLTLVTATPVMTTTQSAKTTLYYALYNGNQAPIYDGSLFTMTAITELSVATTDTTKSPAAIGASKVNDWFIWSDAGTLRLGHGPDWTNDTTRSAGTALTMVNGIYLNNAAITNGPAASRGTYVGTTRSNASSQLDWQFGALAAGGTPGFFGLWNAYNRTPVASMTRDSVDTYGLTTVATWSAAFGSPGHRCTLVRGLDEDAVLAQFTCTMFAASGANYGAIGIGLDTTTGYSGIVGGSHSTTPQTPTATYSGFPGLGVHFLQAVQLSQTSGGFTFCGDAGVSWLQSGLHTLLTA